MAHCESSGAAARDGDDEDDRATRKEAQHDDGDRRDEVLGVEASVLSGTRPCT